MNWLLHTNPCHAFSDKKKQYFIGHLNLQGSNFILNLMKTVNLLITCQIGENPKKSQGYLINLRQQQKEEKINIATLLDIVRDGTASSSRNPDASSNTASSLRSSISISASSSS